MLMGQKRGQVGARAPSSPQRSPNPAEGQEVAAGAPAPPGTRLWAKATSPPAAAVPSLPSEPDFNSNISSGVINKHRDPPPQRGGAQAASACPEPQNLPALSF